MFSGPIPPAPIYVPLALDRRTYVKIYDERSKLLNLFKYIYTTKLKYNIYIKEYKNPHHWPDENLCISGDNRKQKSTMCAL